MEDICLGAGVLAMLIPTNNLIISIAKYKPHLAMGIPGISMFVNSIIILTYGAILKSYSVDSQLFVGGILLAIFISMIIKLNKLIKY